MTEETPSPFIPGTKIQWAFDSTSLGYFKECARKYHFTMIDGWRKRDESVHLVFGSLYHTALEHHEKNLFAGMDYEASLCAVVREAMTASSPWPFDHNLKTRETLIRSIIWQIETFKTNGAKTIQLTNGNPAVELSFRFDLGVPIEGYDSYRYMLSGHLDQVIEFGGDVFVLDHKTTSTMPTSFYFDKFSPDLQMSIYTLAGQVVYQLPLKGVMIDAAQVLVGGTRYERGMTYRTQGQLNEFLEETIGWMKLQRYHAEKDFWPANEKSCDKYGGCPFREICSKDPSSRQAFLESGFEKQKPWNPLEVR